MHASEPLHRQDAGRGILREHARHDDAVVLAEQRADLLQRGRFLLVVGFPLQPHPQVVELLLGVLPVAAQPGRKHEQEQVAKVLANRAGDARILNLDGHLFARLEPCRVDLSQRSRGKGPLVERGEQIFRVVAQLVVHHFLEQRPVHRRRVEVQPLERLDELARRDVGKVGQRLADFHRRAAQIAHRVEHAEGRPPMGFGQRAACSRRRSLNQPRSQWNR